MRPKGPAPVDANAAASLASVMGWDGDVDWPDERTQQPPVDRRGTVTQDGLMSAGEHRRHPTCLFTQPSVAHGVDALMNAMQPPLPHALGDRGRLKPCLDELSRRNDSMLHKREARYSQIDRGAFPSHEDVKAPRVETLPPGGEFSR
jgi:hypothetical protein